MLPATITNLLQQKLNNLQLQFIMNPYMGGDFSLTSDAIYLPNLLCISTLAGIFEKATYTYGPFSTPSIPTISATKAVSFILSESVFDNVIWVYFRANKVRLDNQPTDFGYNFTLYANVPPSIIINDTAIYSYFNGTLNGYFSTNGTLAFSVLFRAVFSINLLITTEGNIIAQIPAITLDGIQLTYFFFC